jgi:hypothetical protein
MPGQRDRLPIGRYYRNMDSSRQFIHYHVFNSTQQAARLQAVLTNLNQKGVSVTVPQADLTAGNVKATMQWLMTYYKANPSLAPKGNRTAWHCRNTTFSQGS